MAKRTKRLTSQGIEQEEVRINKFLSEAGICSRREADNYIQEGRIQIDGITAVMGSKVGRDSLVTFDGKPIHKEEKLVLIALHKPVGIVCTTDPREPDNIVDFVKYGMRIYPIGRLDKDSEGLILMTNDGNIVNKILRAENNHEKEYIVTVNKEITADFINKMSEGVPILGRVTNPCVVKAIDRFTFSIILTQGWNRQIRRMCEYFDYRVTQLVRIRIMNIQLGRLKVGDYRNVTEKEIEDLNALIAQNPTLTSEDDMQDTDGYEKQEYAKEKNEPQSKKGFDKIQRESRKVTSSYKTAYKRRDSYKGKDGLKDREISKDKDGQKSRDGFKGRDESKSREGYKGRDESKSREGYKGRDESKSREGYKRRDESKSREGYKRRDESKSREGYKGRDDSSKDRDGYKGREDASKGRDGYKRRDDSSKGRDGYKGREDVSKGRDGYKGREDVSKGRDGYKGREDSSKGRDGYKGRDDSKGHDAYKKTSYGRSNYHDSKKSPKR